MPIVQAGSINPASILVAGVYTIVVPPPVVLQGAPTDTLGVVGVASWGPVNSAITLGDPSGAMRSFGGAKVRKHDLSSAVTVAALQGASSFRCVRFTDGTDVAASFTLAGADLAAATVFWANVAAAVNAGSGVLRGASALVRFDPTAGRFSGLYTGTVGNTLGVVVSQGSKIGTFRLTVTATGGQPEIFDNIIPDPAHLPAAAIHALSGGTDGDTGVTSLMMVGVDVAPRTGMYALRNQGTSAFILADCDDPTAWSVQIPFAQAEGTAAYMVSPAGDTLANFATTKASAGVDDYSAFAMFGDWLYWNDEVNNVIRLISPATVEAGKRVSLAPNESCLNKPVYGIIGSQKSGQVGSGVFTPYVAAEIEALIIAGGDVIGNPSPGGAYWAAQVGHNSSSDASRQSDTYTQMINFVARTINGGMGIYVGRPNSLTQLRQIEATLSALCAGMETAGLIGDDNGVRPYSVVCDLTNNPDARRGLGFTQADVKIRFQGITERLLVNLQGGSTVTF